MFAQLTTGKKLDNAMLKSGRDKGSRGWVLEKECISGQHTTEPSPVSTCVMCEVGWRVLEEGSQLGWCHLISWARSVTSWGGYYSKIWFFFWKHTIFINHFIISYFWKFHAWVQCILIIFTLHSLPPAFPIPQHISHIPHQFYIFLRITS